MKVGSKKGKEGEGRVVRGVRRVRMGGQGRERSKKGKEERAGSWEGEV